MDRISKEARSVNMSRIGSKDTKPELLVRRALFSLGFRYRLHSTKLHGRPDVVLTKYKLAIFVHGCFWHSHANCKEASKPKTNSDFWQKKLIANVERDKRNVQLNIESGWKVLIVWECELKDDIELNKLMLQKKIDNVLKGIYTY